LISYIPEMKLVAF
jgi:Lateral organ boundaries (LOB) domain